MTDNLRPSPALTVTEFGELADGRSVELYRPRTADLELSVSTYGGRIVTLYMIAPDGERTNVVLGFDSLQDYIAKAPRPVKMAATTGADAGFVWKRNTSRIPPTMPIFP
jgi:galactose mutarotase-like enzyme